MQANGLQDKIRDFKRERISLILANEGVGNLGSLGMFRRPYEMQRVTLLILAGIHPIRWKEMLSIR